MLLAGFFEHSGNDISLGRERGSAHRARALMLVVGRVAVRTSEEMGEVVLRPGPSLLRLRWPTRKHDAMNGLSPPEHLAAERTRAKDLKRVAAPFGHRVCQLVVVASSEADDEVDQHAYHDDHQNQNRHVHSEIVQENQACLHPPLAANRLSLMPTFFVVATPIGNLEDITQRALRTLSEVDLVVCEDTRHSQRLLNHYGIHKPLRSAHGHNERQSAAAVVESLKAGQDVAYVSDAGSPGVSDPGRVLVRTVRDAGYPVVPIPGPSALAAMISVNGLPGKAITFEGFLSPRAGRRRSRLQELLSRDESFILYESPHRIVKLLADLSDLDSERPVLLGRELTKIHEELVEGTAQHVYELLRERQSVKGECALLVGPPKKG